MNRTKNETKERTIYGCAIGLSLLAIVALWCVQCFQKGVDDFADSIGRAGEDLNQWRSKNMLRIDTNELKTKIFAKGAMLNFVAVRTNKDSIQEHQLKINSINTESITYSLKYIVNKRSQSEIYGIATIDSLSIGTEEYLAADTNLVYKPAYRFIDANKTCPIEILITKRNLNSANAMVNESCNGNKTKMTSILTRK